MSKSKSGPSMTPEGATLYKMIKRCTDPRDPAFARYGGRGISVCADWMFGRDGRSKYETFIADMGRRPSRLHTIERVDNDGNYELSNCRWATRAEQNINKRNNRHITIDGETKVLAEWSRVLGIPEWTIRRRIARGQPVRPCA